MNPSSAGLVAVGVETGWLPFVYGGVGREGIADGDEIEGDDGFGDVEDLSD